MKIRVCAFFVFFLVQAGAVLAAPYAAMVIDGRTGEVLHSRNADAKLHPASLTKMMTLYVTFEALKKGEISLDTKVKISRKAASEPPSKLGLRAGQNIAVRHLIRATAVKSANDAATALGEAVAGSEAAMAARMTRTAKALGMSRTTFKNMHGLTQAGHLSTARDMTTLGRHLFYDYPAYYNLFSRISTHAGIKNVLNTNRRFLSQYSGADGIKTGYTSAAGYTLVASAERGSERIIATVFGARSSADRANKMAGLIDMGFSRAPTRVAVVKPSLPDYSGGASKAKVVVVASSPRPRWNPDRASRDVMVARAVTSPDAINSAVMAAIANSDTPPARPETIVAAVEEAQSPSETIMASIDPGVVSASIVPVSRPRRSLTENVVAPLEEAPAMSATEAAVRVALTDTSPHPRPRSRAKEPVTVTRISTSGGRNWGIKLGRYGSRHQAERVLLKTALTEIDTLDQALRKVVSTNRGYEANFVGLPRDVATLACNRLKARKVDCSTTGPV